MKKWVDDFRQFAMRGNVVDMAVGIVIGAAFAKIVSALVAGIISPLIALLTGGFDFANLKILLRQASTSAQGVVRPEVAILYGDLIQVCLDFIIIAFAIFWVIRIIQKMHKKKLEQTPPPATPEEVILLRQIRDILQDKDNKSQF